MFKKIAKFVGAWALLIGFFTLCTIWPATVIISIGLCIAAAISVILWSMVN